MLNLILMHVSNLLETVNKLTKATEPECASNKARSAMNIVNVHILGAVSIGKALQSEGTIDLYRLIQIEIILG